MLQAKTPRVTIQDVVALAGLSIRTVSRALRNRPNVSVQARAKVGDPVGNLGRVASSSASGRTGSVATTPQPEADQGMFAANLLIERLDRSGLPNPPTSHVLETKLMARKSTRRQR